MRVACLPACLLLIGCQQGYYVYGDSLTSPGNSWAHQVTTHHLQVQAMPGLRLVDLTIPRWIGPTEDMKGVLLFIGANDAGQGVDIALFEQRLVALIDQAHAQGLEVACVAIPRWPSLPHTHEPFDPYRAVQAARCPRLLVVEVTAAVMADSPDGLHWGPAGQGLIARQLEEQL